MGPLLGELSPSEDQIVKPRPLIRTKAGKEYLVMRRHEDVGVVDLYQSELPDRAAEIARTHRTAGPGPIEALRRKRDATRFGLRKMGPGHAFLWIVSLR